MDKLLESMCITFSKIGCKCTVVDAPSQAVTFDKMLVVFSDESCKMIRQVQLYSSKEQKFIAAF